MSLMLDLIQLALLEVMKRKNYERGKSIDLEKTAELAVKMHAAEKNFNETIELEIAKFSEICDKIEQLFAEKIFPEDSLVVVENFMESWNEYNKQVYAKVKSTDHLIEQTVNNAERLRENAMKMLTFTNKNIEEMLGESKISDEPLPMILRKVNQVLPVIVDFIRKFYSSLDGNQSSTFEEETKFVSEKFKSFTAIVDGLKTIHDKMETSIKPWIEMMKRKQAEKAANSKDEEPEYMLAIKAERERKDQELMSLLREPHYELNLDAPRESAMCQRISLKDDESSKNQNNLNETAMYRMPRVSFMRKAPRQPTPAGPSNSSMKPPTVTSIFGKINTRDLLDRVSSRQPGNSRTARLNQSRYLGVVPTIVTPKLSSTMMNFEHDHGLFDCTGVSEIRSNSPQVDSPVESETPFKPPQIGLEEFVTPVFRTEEISPRRKLIQQFNKEPQTNRHAEPEKLVLPLSESNNGKDDDSEKTISNEKSSSGSNNATCIDATFAAFQIKNDEDLFNISDTILNNFDSPM